MQRSVKMKSDYTNFLNEELSKEKKKCSSLEKRLTNITDELSERMTELHCTKEKLRITLNAIESMDNSLMNISSKLHELEYQSFNDVDECKSYVSDINMELENVISLQYFL